jgi:hypothetical protein
MRLMAIKESWYQAGIGRWGDRKREQAKKDMTLRAPLVLSDLSMKDTGNGSPPKEPAPQGDRAARMRQTFMRRPLYDMEHGAQRAGV